MSHGIFLLAVYYTRHGISVNWNAESGFSPWENYIASVDQSQLRSSVTELYCYIILGGINGVQYAGLQVRCIGLQITLMEMWTVLCSFWSTTVSSWHFYIYPASIQQGCVVFDYIIYHFGTVISGDSVYVTVCYWSMWQNSTYQELPVSGTLNFI